MLRFNVRFFADAALFVPPSQRKSLEKLERTNLHLLLSLVRLLLLPVLLARTLVLYSVNLVRVES